VGLAAELLKEFEHLVGAVTLVPADGGKFEVSVNGRLAYSKLKTNRHVQPGEVIGLVKGILEG
jgi:selenoprotein W-related protein